VWRDLLAAGLADSLSVLEHMCQKPVNGVEEQGLDRDSRRHGQDENASDSDSLVSSPKVDLELLSTCIPLLCTNPEQGVYADGKKDLTYRRDALGFVRRYIWGEIDVLAAKFSDTGRLYSSLLSKGFASVS
jgi:hypothetical protein